MRASARPDGLFGNGQFTVSRLFFARFLAAILFCAFVSLGCQVRGLFGERGIVPVGNFLQMAKGQLGVRAYWEVPTLCWFGAGDRSLIVQCATGAILAVVLGAGISPGACALLCWLLYLSLCAVGSPFLDFQWDALILETTFLAVFFLPWRVRADWQGESRVAWVARLLLCWLLFRLVFESGVVKLSSGDPTWRAGTALDYHFETQPLPLCTAWFAHQMPKSLLKLSTWAMFAIELVAPWLLLGPRRCRHAGAWAIIALQVGILSTGNYAFFNWLTIALCLVLFENAAWPRFCRPVATSAPSARDPSFVRIRRWGAWLLAPLAALILVVTGSGLIGTFRAGLPLRALHQLVGPLRTFNAYGLFAVMTTSRPEICVEGSRDGQIWKEYQFKWKPGDLRRPGALVAPHQPRLDWQMWFAALGRINNNPWFVNFLVQLLQGSPEVADLLAANPFPDHAPRYVRAVLYNYHFTRFGEGPAWWKREPLGLYCPAISLQEVSR